MAEDPNLNSPLRVHFGYEYLPVRHLGLILESFAQTNRAVLTSLRRTSPVWSASYKETSPFDLCVYTAYTGNSIELGFAPKGQFLPRTVITRDHHLRVELPLWTTPAVLVGAAIIGGAHIYGQFLDIELKRLEIQRAHREMERPEVKDERFRRIEAQLRQINADEVLASPNVSRWANNVRRRMSEPNIHSATINGVRVRPSVPREEREL
jgi:hypothetical protein